MPASRKPPSDADRLGGDRVTTCPPGSAQCTNSQVDLEPSGSGEFAHDIKLGGLTYES